MMINISILKLSYRYGVFLETILFFPFVLSRNIYQANNMPIHQVANNAI